MSSQIQITGETKVKSLTGVLVGTSGVVSSLNIDGSLGIPQLDVNGKILVSQLPNSVMEYKGTWDASTNTPTLANGTGNQGDVYLCSVAGTVNFGAGPISFVVSDQVIYSGSIWQKASGTSGTVTSVAASITGNSLGITGSPITTAGTLAFAFAGTNLQYVNGAGNLTTFPTLLSSVGLSMPSAFSVANSPLTANGTIAVTGAGYPSQYIRGDGTLADFPTSGGGGSSVSYYLNGGTSQGTIGGVTYYEMSKTADTGTGVDFNKTGDGFIVAFLTDAGDPAQLNIPAGNWNYEIYASMSANGGTPEMYAELYKYDGTTFTLISTSSNEILYDGVNLNLYTFAMTVPATTLAITDRLAIKLYATNSGGKITTVHTQDSHLCQVITTFSTGITALNGLTAQVQYFATGTSGTDFNISSTTATHTFNLPVASASNTGKLSSTDWSTFNGKVPYTGATANVDLGNFNFDANEIRGGSIIAKLNGLASSPFILMTGSSGYIFGYDAISLISSPTTANTLILTSNIGVVTKTAQIGLGSLTATRTYTLPDANGTLALLENTNTFTLANTFNYASKNESGTLFKVTGSYTTVAGYNGIAGIANGLYVVIGTTALHGLYFNNSTNYSYTFPNASGTLALTSDIPSLANYVTLTTTQTISGAKTFTSDLNAAKVAIANSNTLYTTTGYTTLSASNVGTTSWIAYVWGNVGGAAAILSFDNTAQYTYTFPAASGTIALTSSLSSYVPYTGATADVDLGNNSLYLNNSEYIFGRNVGNTTAYNILGINSSNKVQIDASGLGTIFGGAATIFGLLTGTTAAFSDSGTATNTNLISLLQPNLTASSGPILTLGKAIAINNAASIQFYYTSSGSSSNSLLLALYGSTGLTIYGNGNGSIAGSFTIGSTLSNGTYTYTLPSATGTLPVGTGTSGQVVYWNGTNTQTGSSNHFWDATNSRLGINTNAPLSPLQVVIGAGSGTVARFGEASGTTGKQLLVGVDTTTGRSELQSVWQGTSATPLALNPSSGSVLIGTTTDSGYRLDVNGTFRAAGAATFSSNVGIGTSSPGTNTLQVSATSTTNAAYIEQNSTGNGLQVTTSGTAGTSFIFKARSTGVDRFWIGDTGNVGIGTISPNFNGFSTALTINGSSSCGLELTTAGTNRGYLGSDGSSVFFVARTNIPMQFYTNDTRRMEITSGGNLEIKASNANSKTIFYNNYSSGATGMQMLNNSAVAVIDLNGNNGGATLASLGTGLVYSNAGTLTSTNPSDERLKENITDISWGLDDILKLRPVHYTWKEDRINQGVQFGFIAQEVKEIMPQAIKEFGDDVKYLGLEKDAIYATLVKAIQELQEQINELKNK